MRGNRRRRDIVDIVEKSSANSAFSPRGMDAEIVNGPCIGPAGGSDMETFDTAANEGSYDVASRSNHAPHVPQALCNHGV